MPTATVVGTEDGARLLTLRFAIALIALAWCLVLVAPSILVPLWRSCCGPSSPFLPAVGIKWSPSTGGHGLVSEVVELFRALFVGGLAVVLAEAAKGLVLLSRGARTRGCYLSLLSLQLALVFDAFRVYAYDWLVYGGSLLGIVELRENSMAGQGTLWASKFPWVSIPFLLIAVALLALRSRSEAAAHRN